ncbi:hypothetical protein BO82DRAFT_35341 [Aspergillus uvarum CBS 121591]|uniref:Uncharacterized protein n=1 Tax=Aspergillus uvarum CBS 121591 TaxID=1448315 RepID=A0A319CJ46_9EURO|nr:hypothetical protein BO82DRAFT_35341 [Aspergillus uvarum CBS 121591]PYH83851.1 hypothetical protein BO82DRAFT_35341 [Aspergillus uvarum CBS 121591]
MLVQSPQLMAIPVTGSGITLMATPAIGSAGTTLSTATPATGSVPMNLLMATPAIGSVPMNLLMATLAIGSVPMNLLMATPATGSATRTLSSENSLTRTSGRQREVNPRQQIHYSRPKTSPRIENTIRNHIVQDKHHKRSRPI